MCTTRKNKIARALPNEVLLHIFCNFEEVKDLVSASMVCANWHRVASDDDCWRIVARDYLHMNEDEARGLVDIRNSYARSLCYLKKFQDNKKDLHQKLKKLHQQHSSSHDHSEHKHDDDSLSMTYHYDMTYSMNVAVSKVFGLFSNTIHGIQRDFYQSKLDTMHFKPSDIKGTLEYQIKH